MTVQSNDANVLRPLEEFYVQCGKQLPKVKIIAGEAMPEPYRQLLVHKNDMTTTLERFHQSEIKLNVLQCREIGDALCRQVVLYRVNDQRPVEYGAIRIELNGFNEEVQRLILDGIIPLGGILHTMKVKHSSRPKCFIELQADEHMISSLKLAKAQKIYGRCNSLVHEDGSSFAEIVEILPPDNSLQIKV